MERWISLRKKRNSIKYSLACPMKVKKVIREKRAALGKINSHEIQVLFDVEDIICNNLKLVFARYVTAHAPLKELTRECMMPSQKYTSSQHGNKCLKEEIRSVTKVVFVSKDKASFVRKDTTGT